MGTATKGTAAEWEPPPAAPPARSRHAPGASHEPALIAAAVVSCVCGVGKLKAHELRESGKEELLKQVRHNKHSMETDDPPTPDAASLLVAAAPAIVAAECICSDSRHHADAGRYTLQHAWTKLTTRRIRRMTAGSGSDWTGRQDSRSLLLGARSIATALLQPIRSRPSMLVTLSDELSRTINARSCSTLPRAPLVRYAVLLLLF